MMKHLELKHGDFLANLKKMYPQASKQMDIYINKALKEDTFKPSKNVIPLTIDNMKLHDTKTQTQKNYGGINGRIAKQIGLIFRKDFEAEAVEHKCLHCYEVIADNILKDHLKNVHSTFFTNLFSILTGLEEDKMSEFIVNAANLYKFKFPGGKEEDEEKNMIEDRDIQMDTRQPPERLVSKLSVIKSWKPKE